MTCSCKDLRTCLYILVSPRACRLDKAEQHRQKGKAHVSLSETIILHIGDLRSKEAFVCRSSGVYAPRGRGLSPRRRPAVHVGRAFYNSLRVEGVRLHVGVPVST